MAGLRFEKRRKDWLLGRWAAKQLVAKCCIPQSSGRLDGFQICVEESGAPYAADLSGKRLQGCLSISHRAGAALCAFTQTDEDRIGADLEWIEPKEDAFFEDYFTAREQAVVHSCPVSQKSMTIALIWSAKESVLKALGTGLRIDTRKIEVRIDRSDLGGCTGDEWLPMTIAGSAIPDDAIARWKVHQNFIFTVACLGKPSMTLNYIP